ncbi:MAG: hypothetical protein JOZ64_10920, partial [Solirubrobacterales bacterium]|nr:hypothetical protein [Solirubrobacterales bacterium]
CRSERAGIIDISAQIAAQPVTCAMPDEYHSDRDGNRASQRDVGAARQRFGDPQLIPVRK